MRLSFWDRIRYAITRFSDFTYPKVEPLPPKPWHLDGDEAFRKIATNQHPRSAAFIAHLKRTGLLIGTGSAKPHADGAVDGRPLNRARKTDGRYRVIDTNDPRQVQKAAADGVPTLMIDTGWISPWGAEIRYRDSMMQEGNPMEGYSDAKLHVYDDLDLDRGPVITEIQNLRTWPFMKADQVFQYSTDISSWDARGASAAHLPIAEQILRYDDVIRDKQRYRASMGIREGKKGEWIFPAMASDAQSTAPDAVPFGVILRADPGTPARLEKLGYSKTKNPQTWAILECFMGPGIVILDTSNNNTTNLEPDARWDQKDLEALKKLVWDDFKCYTLDPPTR